MLILAQPSPEEAAPFYAPFLCGFPGGHVGMHLQSQARELHTLCAGLGEASAMFRYADDKWTVKEVIGHLLDTERVYAYRLLRIARGDETPMPGFDERSYAPAGEFNLRSVSALVSEFIAQRESTLALVNGIPTEAWVRTGTANGYLTSARALAYIILGHTKHHLQLLRERYALPAHSRGPPFLVGSQVRGCTGAWVPVHRFTGASVLVCGFAGSSNGRRAVNYRTVNPNP